jgi:uncharacterized membrane protein YhaH (DUF805 family)
MAENNSNENVIHPSTLVKKPVSRINRFNTSLALKITNSVGSMWSAYIFTLLALVSLPATLSLVVPSLKPDFPNWLISVSLISLVAWIAQTFLQLVLLPIIMVGQNVIQGQQDAKADADHKTLTYLANLQEEQMTELKNQGLILEFLKKEIKSK